MFAKKINLNIKKNIIEVLVLLLIFLLFVRDIGNVEINKYCFIIVCALIFLLCDKQGIYKTLGLLIPCFAGLPYTFICAIALAFVLIKSFQSILLDGKGILCCCIILLIELSSAFWGLFSFIEYLRFLSVFMLTFVFVFDQDKSYDYCKILKNYIWGLFIAIADILGQMLSQSTFSEILGMNVRIGDAYENANIVGEEMRMAYNSNLLSVLCVVAVMICLVLAKYEKRRLYYIIFIIMICLGIMTQSRAFIFVFLIGIILYIFFGSKGFTSFVKKVAIIIISLAATVISLFLFIPEYVYGYIDRFTVADISNGRIDIFQSYIYAFWHNPEFIPFGAGMQNYQVKYGLPFSSHFGLQEILVTWGVIGLFFVVMLFIRLFKNTHFANKEKLIYAIPIISVLISVQSGQLFTSLIIVSTFIVTYSCTMIEDSVQHPNVRKELRM